MNNRAEIERAFALYKAQRIEDALALVEAAVARNPRDARLAFANAQFAFEAWRPAAALFARAKALNFDHPDLIRNHALALAAEGAPGEAQTMLEQALAAQPLWLDGHRALAALRVTHACEPFDASYAAAVQTEPGHPGLRMAWFQQHAIMKRWGDARRILADAQAVIGANRQLDMAALYLDSEGDAADDLAARFAVFDDVRDPGLDLCQVRWLLRQGEAARADAIAGRHGDGPAARMFLPYRALCWRLTGDKRALWLDGDPLHIAVVDLAFADGELDELATVLGGLHRMKAPYPEQSVRGGTQTDRQLFFHPHPAIQQLRAKVTDAIADWRAQLPTHADGHPLLGPPRDKPIRFAGSWSVRLAGAGHHAPHTHTHGWISSAFYVALPDLDEPQGWLALGTPPPELGLALSPYRTVEPRPGRLVLFPSTMWHATIPFDAGTRLTVAFDVAVPET